MTTIFNRIPRPFQSIILKKLGSPIMTNLYYGTVKQLLERISSVMIDREAIQKLVSLVKEALTGGDLITELDLDASVAGERGLRLLLVLAFILTKTKGAILSSPTLVSEDIVDVSRKAVSVFTEILFERMD